jgi:hypothetical protein
MITKISTPYNINIFIINTLESFVEKGKNINNLNTCIVDRFFGVVEFKKKKKNEYIDITFKQCKYGYDFYNKQIIVPKEDECCVCYDNTLDTIKCGHIICDKCVREIMKHSKTLQCPLCRVNQEIEGGLHIRYPIHLATLLFNVE